MFIFFLFSGSAGVQHIHSLITYTIKCASAGEQKSGEYVKLFPQYKVPGLKEVISLKQRGNVDSHSVPLWSQSLHGTAFVSKTANKSKKKKFFFNTIVPTIFCSQCRHYAAFSHQTTVAQSCHLHATVTF